MKHRPTNTTRRLHNASRIALLNLCWIMAGISQCQDSDPDNDGWTEEAGDCAPDDGTVYPGATERCDNIDNNCDQIVDEDCVAPIADATAGYLENVFDLEASGRGTQEVGDVNFPENVGTIEIGGELHHGVAYYYHDWVETGYVLYDIVSIAENGENLAVSYLYCQNGSLPYIYMESFFHAMDWEYAQGTCSSVIQTTSSYVELPALWALPPEYDSGITIEGEQIELLRDQGWIQMEGQDYTLLPFSTVDCTNCPGGPWLEIHTLFVGSEGACFGILYLFPDDPTYVYITYVLCLPQLTRPLGQGASYSATWSGELLRDLPLPPVGRPKPKGIPNK